MTNSDAAKAAPAEGYIVEVGGKFVSEYGSFTAALKAGFALRKTAQSEVKVYDADERMPE